MLVGFEKDRIVPTGCEYMWMNICGTINKETILVLVRL